MGLVVSSCAVFGFQHEFAASEPEVARRHGVPSVLKACGAGIVSSMCLPWHCGQDHETEQHGDGAKKQGVVEHWLF